LEKLIKSRTKNGINLPDKQGIPTIMDAWEDVLAYALSFDGKAFFGDAHKLRVFSQNCLESYKEYGIINTYSSKELRAILYYFGRNFENDKCAPTGKDLQFIHLIIKKIREQADEQP
jgi:hypothetical protein